MKQFNRIFTLGCSFTSYNWPTWADLLIKGVENKNVTGYNLGIAGAGNNLISQRFLEAYKYFKIDSNDLVLICWTSTTREDRWLGTDWSRYGNVYTSKYYEKLPKEFLNEDHFNISSVSSMFYVNEILKINNIEHLNFSMHNYLQSEWSHIPLVSDAISDIMKFFDISFELPSMMDYLELNNRSDSKSTNRPIIIYPENPKNKHVEHHPTTLEHFKYLKEVLIPSLSLNIEYKPILELCKEYNFLDDYTKPVLFPQDKYYNTVQDAAGNYKKKHYNTIAPFYKSILNK